MLGEEGMAKFLKDQKAIGTPAVCKKLLADGKKSGIVTNKLKLEK